MKTQKEAGWQSCRVNFAVSDPMLFVKIILTLALTLVVYALFGLPYRLLYDVLAHHPMAD
jgi:hypothetical protein